MRAGLIGEFKGLILATTVWFEVLEGFAFLVYVLFAISKTKMLRIRVAHELLVAHKLTPAFRGPSWIIRSLFVVQSCDFPGVLINEKYLIITLTLVTVGPFFENYMIA